MRSLTSLSARTFKNLRKADDIADVKTKHEMMVSIKVHMNKIESICKHKKGGWEEGDGEEDGGKKGGAAAMESLTALDGVVEGILRGFEHDIKLNDMFCDALSQVAELKAELEAAAAAKKELTAASDGMSLELAKLKGEAANAQELRGEAEADVGDAVTFIAEIVESVKETVEYEMASTGLGGGGMMGAGGVRGRGRTASSFSSSPKLRPQASSKPLSMRAAVQQLESVIDDALGNFRR